MMGVGAQNDTVSARLVRLTVGWILLAALAIVAGRLVFAD